jgi:hypothetical protein
MRTRFKSERGNPGGSIKGPHRAGHGRGMAEKSARCSPAASIIDADLRQYRHRPGDGRGGQGLLLVMPEALSVERRCLMSAYGALT